LINFYLYLIAYVHYYRMLQPLPSRVFVCGIHHSVTDWICIDFVRILWRLSKRIMRWKRKAVYGRTCIC